MERKILKSRLWVAVLPAFFFCLECLPAQEGDVVGVHDPCIIKEGRYYYVFSTHDGIRVCKSQDLIHWQREGSVFEETPEWVKERLPEFNNDPWAPDISFFNGKYHLYYAVSLWGKNRSLIGLATNRTLDCSSSLFHWKDEGLVVESFPGRDNYNCIDPNLALDQNGKPWLTFGSYFSGIMMVPLDNEGRKPLGKPHLIAGRNGGAIEAPFIVRKGRFYYLFVSFDSCCQGVNSTYKIMVGRSQRITGPYVDMSGKRMLEGGGTVVLSGYGRYKGPGHNAFLREKDADYLVHHFYDADHGGRHALQIRPVIWDRGGWPLAGEPIDEYTKRVAPGGNVNVAGRWQHWVNSERRPTITLYPNGTINGDSNQTWTLRGNLLRMTWKQPGAPPGGWVDLCYVSRDGRWYVGRNQDGTEIRGIRDE